MKQFGLGITVGRFQTFHNGHKDLIDRAVKLCGEVGVFIGSSQESGTFTNPFTYEMREHILRRVYGKRIKIFPLPDIGAGNTSVWGEYVLKNVEERFGRRPDLLVSGKEARRVDWFDGVKGLSIAELYIPKSIDISATQMRRFLVDGDFGSWKEFTPAELWDEFDAMREIVIASQDNKITSSI